VSIPIDRQGFGLVHEAKLVGYIAASFFPD
jgi:hypothetical protein